MRPPRGRIIKAGDVGVGIVLVGKGCQINSTETRNAEVVIVAPAVEGLQVLRDIEIGARPTQSLIQRYGESLGELREGRNGGELLSVLVVLLVLDVPKPFGLNEVSARTPATDLAIEGRLLGGRLGLVQTQVG